MAYSTLRNETKRNETVLCEMVLLYLNHRTCSHAAQTHVTREGCNVIYIP